MKELYISGRRIADDTECFLIAEIGHNHQGSLDKCKELFRAAKKAGATAVKLQKRDNKNLFTEKFFNQPYLSENAYGPTYGAHREALEFSLEQLEILKEYADELGIVFFATPFDVKSVDALSELNVPCFKIASCDIRNHPLIKYIARLQKPIIMSTGGATLEEICEAVSIVLSYHSQLAILQCTAAYPPDDKEINLSVINLFAKEFPKAVIGYSSHDLGGTMSLAAYAMGARVIEKHFTLDKSLPGSDHKLSLSPDELCDLSLQLKRLHVALGNGSKRTYDSEKASMLKMGKKIVAAKDLPAGHIVEMEDLLIRSPGDGLSPSLLPLVVGKRLSGMVMREEDLSFSQLQ